MTLLWPNETKEVFDEARLQAKKHGIHLTLPPYEKKPLAQLQKFCSEPFQGFYIYPDGECYPCTYLLNVPSCGNILDNTVEDIFSASTIRNLRKCLLEKNPPQACIDCLCDLQNVEDKYDRNFEVRFVEQSHA